MPTLQYSIPTMTQHEEKVTIPTASVTAPLVTTPGVITPSIEVTETNPFTNTTQPVEKDFRHIAPSFFVGPVEKKPSVSFGVPIRSENDALSQHHDRRLSGILAQEIDKQEEEKKQEAQVHAKRINLGVADANRGFFGDRKLQSFGDMVNSGSIGILPTTTDTNIALQSTKTIRVFGYPLNLIHNVIQHFSHYGKIETYARSPGNWITITYESSAQAQSALTANGLVISKNYLIGVTLEPTSDIPHIDNLVHSPEEVFKTPTPPIKKSTLGSGKVGPSAESTTNASNEGYWSTLKDIIFGW